MKKIKSNTREILNIKDVKKGVFIKKYTNIYLVKNFAEDIQNKYKGKYKIEYFFRISTKTSNPQLHVGGVDIADELDFHFKRIKKPTYEETLQLKEKIEQECSRFNLETLSYRESRNKKEELSVEKCIEFLKNKGYIILKQV